GPAVQLIGSNLTTSGLGFSRVPLGATQVSSITLTAHGQAPLSIESITVHGSGNFTETNNCPPLLALGSSCQIDVAFTPTHYGGQSGILTVDDDASNSPQTVELNGDATGSFALVSPDKLDFSCQPLNVASHPLKVGLAAVEGEAFHISSIAA